MISDLELRIQKRNTQAFIDADVEVIVITPRSTRVPDGAGGWRDGTGAPLPPVRVRIVPINRIQETLFPAEGQIDAPKFVLVAMPDTDIQRYDTFVWRGDVWKVDRIHNKPDYELKADLVLENG